METERTWRQRIQTDEKVFTNPFFKWLLDGYTDIGVRLAQYLSVKKINSFQETKMLLFLGRQRMVDFVF
jgi:hypothetical protein